MYDDEIEKTTTIPTTKSPQETWKELEKNIEELEKETERNGNSKLHSGEVVFNADTERALNWLIANMTKATKLAMSETDENSAIPKANPMIDQDNEDRTVLHSGEVIHPKKEHSGERFKWNVAFSSKTKHLVPIKPTRIDGHKYDNAKM
uniref:Uncharacterized protein n=1 Tax=Panagrolaimus sp. JU765 TaxID=591449 RepID=A0AC34RHS6_9BILA